MWTRFFTSRVGRGPETDQLVIVKGKGTSKIDKALRDLTSVRCVASLHFELGDAAGRGYRAPETRERLVEVKR